MPKKCLTILTPREKEVLKNFCFTNKEIAKALNIELSTVKMHSSNICLKLFCKNKASALFEALKQDLIELKDIRTKEVY